MSKKMFLLTAVGCLLFFLVTPVSAQMEFSLDDQPLPFDSAEDQFGLGLPAAVNGFVGPSPSLAMWGFMDSDVLLPGPAFSFPIPGTTFVDGLSADHSPLDKKMAIWIGLRFSVDRVTGGIPGSASECEAQANQQPGDMFDSSWAYVHPANFVPLAPPATPPYGGPLPPVGTGISNILSNDDSVFGLLTGGMMTPPCPTPAPPIQPGGQHDNIDAYNDYPGGIRYYTVAPAETPISGQLPADIMMLGGPVWAFAPQIGLDNFGGPGSDSIDALAVWDYGAPGACEPGIDFALFSLAPGSQTLTQLNNMGFNVDGATIFLTDFQGFFYMFNNATDNGVAPLPVPPLLGNPQDVNIDALDVFQS